MIADQYIWVFWTALLLALWIGLYIGLPGHRSIMWWSSLICMPLGLTQPVYLQAYWTPPSLFGLTQRTGFDLESLLFCFTIAGISIALFKVYSGTIILPTNDPVRRAQINRRFKPAIAAPFVLSPWLYLIWPWNPIYWAILTMLIGALAAMWCLPEWVRKLGVSALLFTAVYAVPLLVLELLAPGYTQRVWNLQDLSGVTLFTAPVEEFLFAICFSLSCNGIYLLLLWNRYGVTTPETLTAD